MATPEKFIPVFDHSTRPNVSRMPEWIRLNLAPVDDSLFQGTAAQVRSNTLNTVCEEARCPNRGECWNRGTATFMLLGETCTRACGFCSVKTGRPEWFDDDEARRVAEATINMGLDYVVLTSVNRDDMEDGGAAVYANSLRELRRRKANIGIEFLTPDFYQKPNAVETIYQAVEEFRHPESNTDLVWGHNVETVPSLYKTVRKGSNYQRSMQLLQQAAALEGVEAKSAIMLGLGESHAEVIAVLEDLRSAGVQRVSLGQYLRPTRFHLPVMAYVTPEEFTQYEEEARAMGFDWVKAGPLVRSSYHAEEDQSK
ncbi:MAG: lipoyl synthase [Gammaproteobacteria bacterium]|nr:lipoyl synthase [Gammaproteobacteria bacterium]